MSLINSRQWIAKRAHRQPLRGVKSPMPPIVHMPLPAGEADFTKLLIALGRREDREETCVRIAGFFMGKRRPATAAYWYLKALMASMRIVAVRQ